MGGFATVSLAAAEAVLDTFNAAHGTEHKAVSLEGKIFKASKSCGTAQEVKVYYDVEKKTRIVDMTDRARGMRQITDMSIGGGFTFDFKCEMTQGCTKPGDWTATGCKGLAAEASTEAAYTKAMGDMNARVAAHIGDEMIVKSNGGYFIGQAKFGDAATKIVVPTALECKAMNDKSVHTAPFVNPTVATKPEAWEDAKDGSGRRLLEHKRALWGGDASHKVLWNAANGAYKTKSPEGLSTWKKCEGGNAYAKFVYKYPTMIVAMAGTDGLSDFGDWADNLNTNKGPGGTHQGFTDYKNKIASCLQEGKDQLAGWGIKIDYLVGHSLGGAAATAHAKHNWSGERGLVTFGAPKTQNGGTCSANGQNGVRYAHIKDSIASPLLNLFSMGDFRHDVKTSKKMYERNYCSSDCWAGCCPWGWSWEKKVADQNCGDTHNDGCKFLLDCGYYFATVHSAYGEYL
jgi:hypothetical protein